MRILVTGGAGYIGSVTTARLLARGHEPVVLDNLSRGHRAAVAASLPLEILDTRDRDGVAEVLDRHRIECVMHFAAQSLVGESMDKPLDYFDANVGGMISLLGAMESRGVGRLILSSTAAVYGEPDEIPIPESAPTLPTNPYGHTKLMCESLMRWQSRGGRLSFVSLRYFNAAGAAGALGEDHRPETHLIPLALQAASGRRPEIVVYGDDYPTPDGTCVRDYIHVEDLADAHILALDVMDRRSETILNLGNGRGFSVRDVLVSAERVTGRRVPARVGPRRPGDPAVLVASSEKAREVLRWNPRRADLDEIVASAWRWMKDRAGGYGVPATG